MYHNRASYQSINPNMPTHKTPKAILPVLAYKDADGTVFYELTYGKLQEIAKHNPSMSTTRILMEMLKGQTFYILSLSVSIAYK